MLNRWFIRNFASGESADELFLNLLGSLLALYLRARPFNYISLQKKFFKLPENEVFQEHQSSKLQRNSHLVVNEQ